ncbi:uncharacterized protein LOC114943844 [Nylanderia fulva]|uniref:uncharacterized protein LOC114943844 n=1 Tax=Nylanderia fulva TaxID=613905 RepID=UPI0010FB4BDE|nr:uncharacterized protein LOC114943844 [Nylanderia fulva]XP_029175398.1 uncharacterized protein LOC114943844 [Nylanderia fulva]
MAQEKFYAVVEFEDGLQIVPNNWLNSNLNKAVWPNFTNNKRYYKAVKFMENPEPTWIEHPIRKIYAKDTNYELARRKLKDAEELSDINSGTDKEELPKMPVRPVHTSKKMKKAKLSQKELTVKHKNS